MKKVDCSFKLRSTFYIKGQCTIHKEKEKLIITRYAGDDFKYDLFSIKNLSHSDTGDTDIFFVQFLQVTSLVFYRPSLRFEECKLL